jgi:hypothetical protein
MRQDERPPRFQPAANPVYLLRAVLPVFAAEDGSPVLPDVILWAFSLNEGDLVTVSPDAADPAGCRFQSFAGRVWAAAEGCSRLWPFIEEMLQLPLAAVGPKGTLRLPETDVTWALRSGGPLLLRAEVNPGGSELTLEPAGERRRPPELILEAGYLLPVLDGFRVSLPADALWVLGLGEGDQLACKPSLATAEFDPFAQVERLEGRSLVELGPGGLLSLPESLRVPAALKANARVRLIVSYSPRVAIRVTQWIED